MNIFIWIVILSNFVFSKPKDIPSTPNAPAFAEMVAHAAHPLPEIDWQHLNDSIVLLQNTDSLIPVQDLLAHDFQILQFGDFPYSTFDYYFRQYANATSYAQVNPSSAIQLADSIGQKNSVFIALVDPSATANLSDVNIALAINKIAERHRILVVNFSDLQQLTNYSRAVTLLQMPKRTLFSEAIAAQVLFGGIELIGTLTDSLSYDLPMGAGEFISATRLAHATPESVGIASEKLQKLDILAEGGVRVGAYPGAQLMVVKEGKIIYDKAFGHHSYDGYQEVDRTDLYDLASITKVAATTLAAMHLYDKQLLDLNAPIRTYISGKSALYYTRMRYLLTHTSGLQSYIPIAKYIYYAKDNGVQCDSIFCTRPLSPYSVQVADGMYLSEQVKARIWKDLFKVKPSKRRTYRYSDLNFVLLQKVIEEQSGRPLDRLLHESIYQPLGLRHLTYQPLRQFESQQIVPTTQDTAWRRQTLRGHVHDEGAALLGGVAGNAGLFSNAQDLAVLFQMLLNGGSYGGKRYFSPATVDRFISKQPKVHRGLGFDKPSGKPGRRPAYAYAASASTFGHTGFTGTCVWADPEHNLIFVLLTNRVHPDKYNKKLVQYNLRAQMHQAVYDALDSATVLE
ncbi:MAG: serine hydrolase [Bacteroidota bacterium]